MSGPRPWAAHKPRAQVWRAVESFGEEGIERTTLRNKLPDLTGNDFNVTVNHLKNLGWLQSSEAPAGGELLRVTAGKVPPIADATGAAPRVALPAGAPWPLAAPVELGEIGKLAERAAHLVLASNNGLASADIAAKLESSVSAVDRALLPAVQDGKLIACPMVRGGAQQYFYRESASSTAGYAWGAMADVAWSLSSEAMERAWSDRQQHVELAQTPSLKRMPSTPTRAAVAPTQPRAGLPQARGIPVMPFEVDTDAIYRKQERKAGDAEVQFVCALFSDGRLLIESKGQKVTLPVEHTRKLVHYLERMATSEEVAS